MVSCCLPDSDAVDPIMILPSLGMISPPQGNRLYSTLD